MTSIQREFDSHFKNNQLIKTIHLESNKKYYLERDIVINLNPAFPSKEDIEKNAFLRYGFFAGIVMDGKDIHLDLKGFTIKMSEESNLKLRFFSLIELNNSPFPLRDGLPLNKAKIQWNAGKNITIENGTLGLSSHSGIHGNNNSNIIIHNMVIKDFEVGGIMLNGASRVKITSTKIGPNFQKMKLNAKFSAVAQILHQYEKVFQIEKMERLYTPLLNEFNNTVASCLSNRAINPLFRNEKGVIDGVAYGILINKSGVAIHSHGSKNSDTGRANNIKIKKVTIDDIKAGVDEKIGYQVNGKVIRDIAGQPIDLHLIVQNRKIDIVSFYQLLTAYFIRQNKNSTNSTLFTPDPLLDWFVKIYKPEKFIWNGEYILTPEEYFFLNNWITNYTTMVRGGDSMIHVNKGVIALRLDGVDNTTIYNTVIKNICNIGKMFQKVLNPKVKFLSSNTENVFTYTGNDAYGIVCNNLNEATIDNIKITNLNSENGSTYKCLLMNGTQNITIERIEDEQKKASTKNENYSIVVQESCKKFTIKG